MEKSNPNWMQNSKLKIPTMLFPDKLIFDDGKHRVEALHLGVAYTYGDGLGWMPKERILFTGDVYVNGPYNNVMVGNVGRWVDTLERTKKLGAEIICVGHARSDGTLLDDQQTFFKALQEHVRLLVPKSPAAVKDEIESIRASLKQNPQISRFVRNPGKGIWDPLPSQVAKVYQEITENKLALLTH